MSNEMEPHYDPKAVEENIYRLWEESGYFNPDTCIKDGITKKDAAPFTIIMPPPNANAPMHVGHALFVTVEDIMIRFARMRGRRTLWLPGTDHAGFETQVVFEKKLEKEGRSRFHMTREEFYKEIWDFVQRNKHITEDSLRRLGASCDWSRNIFTLDPRIIAIVYNTFKRMHDDGLIYRGNRICNWCTKHQTGLSDLETKYEEREDPLYYMTYGPITLATVRPETKFGDTGIAVNPKDKRYKKYVGKEVNILTVLGPAKIKVIADDAVDMTFGTGAVKVTPAHDATDFEIWQRHKDEIPGPKEAIDRRGRMTAITGPYAGMKVAEARTKVVEDMLKKKLIVKVDEHYKHNVQLCYKCGTVIEPLIVPQWYVKMTEPLKDGRPSLRDMAVKAVKSGEVKILTERFEKIFLHWMRDLRDWPVSRQIWWGIPIPAWYCGGAEKASVPKMGFAESVVPRLLDGMTRTYRIHDHHLKIGDRVLLENSGTKLLLGHGTVTNVERMKIKNIPLVDPFHKTAYKSQDELLAAFRRHYPPTEKITGATEAILYTYSFEPARKTAEGCGQTIIADTEPKKCPACSSTNLVQDPDTFDTWFSSGQWPFATLIAQGGRDFETYFPTQVMETAADILFFWVARMVMLSYYRTGKPPFEAVYLHGLVRDKDRQKMSKSKGNTIDPLGVIDLYGTDALRFALVFSTAAGNDIPLAEDKIRGMKHFVNKLWNIARYVLANVDSRLGTSDSKCTTRTEADRNILKKLAAVQKEATEDLDGYRFHEAAQAIYQFVWHEFADKYVEASKKQLADEKLKENTQAILTHCLIAVLKLLHPFMPFVTEAVYQKLQAGLPAEAHAKAGKLLMAEKW